MAEQKQARQAQAHQAQAHESQQEKQPQAQSEKANPQTQMTRSRAGQIGRRRPESRGEIDRVFDRLFGAWMSPWKFSESEWHLGMDIDETDKEVVVELEAPGFEPKDFDIQLRGETLVVSAAKSEDEKSDDGREWRRREFYRTVELPAAVEAERVEAHYKNGVLDLVLPKTQQSRSQKIEVKS